MPIVYRHVTRETLRVAAIVLVAVVAVYLAVDFFEKVDDFIEKQVPLTRALVYFTYKLPFVAAQVLPLCLLLAVAIAFGLMNKHNEVLALKAGGVSAARLMVPALALGAFFSLLHLLLAEAVVPATVDRANRIWRTEVRRASVTVSQERNIWIKGNRSITYIRHYHAPSGTIHGVAVNRFDDRFRLVERLDAETGRFVMGRWQLTDVMVQHLESPSAPMRVEFRRDLELDLALAPDDLKRAAPDSSEMSYRDLRRHAAKVEAEGYDATPYRVDLHAKLAFPVICTILAMVGGGLGLHRRAHDSLILAVAAGLGIAFLYWVFHSFCISLGYGQMLPPLLAAWAGNLVFGCVGALAMLGTD